MKHLALAHITYQDGSYTVEKIMKNRLLSGQSLVGGDYLWSKNRKYELAMRKDGNLVLFFHTDFFDPDFDKSEEVWSTNTAGIAIRNCTMETNGNFALYKHNGEIVFQTHTGNRPGADLVLQDDGVISLVQPQIVWSSSQT